MNQQEAFQLLGLVHSLSTFESRASEQALALQATTWAMVLEQVPYAFAREFVVAQAKEGVSVREAPRIASAWAEHRKQTIRKVLGQLVPPDSVPAGAQGRWLQLARGAVGDGATPAQAIAWADQQLQVSRPALTGAGAQSQKMVPAEESVARIRKLAAQWGANRPERE